MAFLRKVKAGLVKADVDYFVGEEGNLFFNIETGEIRLSDGVTEGGLAIGGGSGYTLPAASATVRGGVKIGEGLTIDPAGILSTTGGGGSPLAVSLIDSANTVSGTVSNITALRFDTDSGFDITDLGNGAVKVGMNSTFKTWKVDGQSDLVATGLDTIRFVAGTGVTIETDPLAATKTITFSSTGGTGTAATDSPIKTFNILNEFSAPLLGKSVFVPVSTNIVKSVQLTNSKAVGTDLMVGLYRNNELLNFFTIPAGNYTYKYTGLNYTINTNDYLTVNVVAGSGENFSMGLFNIDT